MNVSRIMTRVGRRFISPRAEERHCKLTKQIVREKTALDTLSFPGQDNIVCPTSSANHTILAIGTPGRRRATGTTNHEHHR